MLVEFKKGSKVYRTAEDTPDPPFASPLASPPRCLSDRKSENRTCRTSLFKNMISTFIQVSNDVSRADIGQGSRAQDVEVVSPFFFIHFGRLAVRSKLSTTTLTGLLTTYNLNVNSDGMRTFSVASQVAIPPEGFISEKAVG